MTDKTETPITEAEQTNDIQSIIDRMARMPTGAMHPDTIPKDLPEDSAFSKAVLHWRYLQREYGRKRGREPTDAELTHPEPDIQLFHDVSVSILYHIQRLTAIRYAIQDAGFNIMRRGVNVDLKTDALQKHLEDLEGLRLTEELATLMGLGEYKAEITLRELDKLFGNASTLAAEQRRREAEGRQFQSELRDLAVQTAEGVKDIASLARNQAKSYGEKTPQRPSRRRPNASQREPRTGTEQ